MLNYACGCDSAGYGDDQPEQIPDSTLIGMC